MFHGPSQQTVKKEFLKLFQIFLKQDLVGGQGQGNGRDGVGGCFTDYDSDECQLTIKHKYRRDCLDSPMCVPNIKNLQGVNKCFMWNWETERRKDEVPDLRNQAFR